MKSSYPFYRFKTAELEKQLTKTEKDLLDDYVKFLSGKCNIKKALQNRTLVIQFRDLIEKPITKVTKKDLEGYWSLVKSSEHEFNYKVMCRRAVKRFVKWHYKNLEMIEGLEVGNFKANRKKINKTVLLTPEEIGKILRTAETLRDKALIILLYESGARPQELRDLKWKDINFENKEVHLDSSKTERARDLPIEESIIHLKRWRQEFSFPEVIEHDFVFPSRWRDKQLSTEQVNNIVKRIVGKSGISKPITSYTFRHSRLTEIYNKGVKGIEHNKFSGHKEGSKQQTVYTHIDNADMKEDVLKKVYNVEEISPEKKHKLEKELENLKKQFNWFLKIQGFEEVSEDYKTKELPNAPSMMSMLGEKIEFDE